MDSILETPQYIVLSEDFEDNSPYYEDIITSWIEEESIIRPSSKVKILETLPPAIYKVDVSREFGIFCKKDFFKSDELFIFSDSIINNLLQEINLFWDKKEDYERNNLVHKRGILLEGFPGTGKSSIITLLCKQVVDRNGVIFKVGGPRNLSIYIEFIKNNFRKIQPDTPIITILEDIEQYDEDLLDFLDGKSQISNHVVLGTTNNSEEVDNCLLRPSRIDLRIEIPCPTKQTRKEYFLFKKVEEETSELLSLETDDFTLADLKELYISVFLLGYTIPDAISKIRNPKEKKDYSRNVLKSTRLGI